MENDTWRKTLIFIIVALLLGTALIVVLQSEDFVTVPTYETLGKVTHHEEELVPRRKITEFLVDNGIIYIFYDDVGLVNAYTVEGDFLYGIQVNTSPNGRGDIAIREGRLLIKSKSTAMYVFKDTELEECVISDYNDYVQKTEAYERETALLQHFSLPKCHSYGEHRYKVSADKMELLVSTDSGGYVPVDFLPQRSPYLPVLLGVFVIAVAFFHGIPTKNAPKGGTM